MAGYAAQYGIAPGVFDPEWEKRQREVATNPIGGWSRIPSAQQKAYAAGSKAPWTPEQEASVMEGIARAGKVDRGEYSSPTASSPTAAIPTAPTPQQNRAPFQFNTPEPTFRMQRPDTQMDALKRVTAAIVADPSNPGVPMFTDASMARAGYDRPEIYNQNVVPAETVSGMVGAMMNPKGDQALSAALRAAAARGDWDAIGRYYASQGQTFGGKMYGDNQESDLYKIAFGSGIQPTKRRDRAASFLSNAAQLQTQRDVEAERQQTLRDVEASRAKTQQDIAGRRDLITAGIRDAATMQVDMANRARYAESYLAETLKPEYIASLRNMTPEQQKKEQERIAGLRDFLAQYTSGIYSNYFGPPTPEGYAQGGPVQPVLNPMGNMGMPSSMADLDPVVRQYAQYVSTASQYGLQPVAFPKFIDLLGAARTKLATLPTQGGAVGFAEGGMVDWLKSFLPGVGPLDTPAPATAPAQTDRQRLGQGAALLGSGMAGQAAQALQGRNLALEEALRAAQGARMGYADGGRVTEDPRDPNFNFDAFMAQIAADREAAVRSVFGNQTAIPVAGQQVLGAGGPKSDSIPAVIDGSRPAALSTGEFVMPTEAVQFFGTDRLNKMIEKARGQ